MSAKIAELAASTGSGITREVKSATSSDLLGGYRQWQKSQKALSKEPRRLDMLDEKEREARIAAGEKARRMFKSTVGAFAHVDSALARRLAEGLSRPFSANA